MPYVEEDDLLLGELTNTLPASIDPTQYLDMTQEEIDSKLGVLYVVPVDMTVLPNSQGSLLKAIHRKLTSHSDTAGHAYGMQLVKEAQMELMAIANADVVLVGAERVDGEGAPRGDVPDAEVADPLARVPGAKNRDALSAVETFEKNFMTEYILPKEFTTWEPGS